MWTLSQMSGQKLYLQAPGTWDGGVENKSPSPVECQQTLLVLLSIAKLVALPQPHFLT